jgi:hypothetical protein
MPFTLPVDLQNNPFIAWFEKHFSRNAWPLITHFIETNMPLKAALSSKERALLSGSLCYAGQQALQLAVIDNQPILVEHLLTVGIYVDVAYVAHETPLIIAAIRGHDEVVRVLCKMGARIDARDAQGFTALMRAAANGYAQVVGVLLDAGADPSCVTEDGYTALMLATSRKHVSAFQGLQHGTIPIDRRVSHVDVRRLLAMKDSSVKAKGKRGLKEHSMFPPEELRRVKPRINESVLQRDTINLDDGMNSDGWYDFNPGV